MENSFKIEVLVNTFMDVANATILEYYFKYKFYPSAIVVSKRLYDMMMKYLVSVTTLTWVCPLTVIVDYDETISVFSFKLYGKGEE